MYEWLVRVVYELRLVEEDVDKWLTRVVYGVQLVEENAWNADRQAGQIGLRSIS
jgi:hypothetical protein